MKVDSFASEDMVLGLRLAAAGELADADVLRSTYAGTTGAEGGADLKGQLKPWVFGRCINVEPVPIDQIDNVFQVSGYGPVQAISAVYERGASFGASVGDFASYAALVAANIPEGRWGTCLAQGMFRLGAPPAGVITCDVDGDNTGGFLRRTGAILNEIANRIGVSAKVNFTSLAGLDAAVARNVNIVIREQISFLELAQRMVAPCNAVPGIGQSGRLIVSRVTFGAEQMVLDAQGRQMPAVLGMARQNTQAPYKRVQMGAARSWRVHSFDEIAFLADLIDRGLYSAAEVYREGNLVETADKARWVYINPTASAGNAPPAWPTASNSFWSNIAPPISEIGGVAVAVLLADVAQAQGDATAAQDDADAANAAIANITTDNILSRDEKPEIRKQRDAVIGEYPTIRARAVALGVSVTAFDAAYTLLITTYLASVDLNSATDTAINRNDFNFVFTNYYSERQTAFDGIAAEAAKRATVAGAEAGLVNSNIGIVDGNLIGIGLGVGTPVSNIGVVLTGVLADRPASGAFIGQTYVATDTREFFRWNGSAWITASDVTIAISGPAELALDYTSADVLATPLPATALYSLTAAGSGTIASGVTWSVSVVSGAFTGTAPSMVGTGSAELRINSGLSTAEAVLQVSASVGGRSYPPFSVRVPKNVLPATSSGGGGGGEPPNIVSDNMLTSVGTSGAFASVSDDLTITLPVGITSVTLTAASLTLRVASTLPEGATNSEFKWQRESSPGVWSDVGGVASSSPSPTVTDSVEFGVRNIAGSVTCNRVASGLTAESTQKFRLVGRFVSGNSKTTTVGGTASAQT